MGFAIGNLGALRKFFTVNCGRTVVCQAKQCKCAATWHPPPLHHGTRGAKGLPSAPTKPFTITGTGNPWPSSLINPTAIGLLSTSSPSLTLVRFKRKKGSKAYKDDESSDDEVEFTRELVAADQLELAPGVKELKAHLPSLRLDIVAKSGFGLSRSKVEKIFYESRLRVNGKKILKKSEQVSLGDEIDLVIGINSESDKFIDIMRLQIVRITVPGDPQANVIAEMRRQKLLTIDNYDDAWSGNYDFK